MTALAAAPPRLDIGRVVGRTFGAIGGNFWPFIVLAILLAAVPAFLIYIGSGYGMQSVVTSYVATGYNYQSLTYLIAAIQLASQLVMMIPIYILVGALTQGSIVFFNGGKASLGECLSTGLRFLLPLIGL